MTPQTSRTAPQGVHRRLRRAGALGICAALLFVACGGDDNDDAGDDVGVTDAGDADAEPATPRPFVPFDYPDAPASPDADEENVAAAATIADINEGIRGGAFNPVAIDELATTGDTRHAWYAADLLRFAGPSDADRLVDAFEALTGVSIADDPDAERTPWLSVTNHLIAWDTPDYPGYQEQKGELFQLIEPAWAPFFADPDADIDWRYLSWGGVFIDDRELGDPNGCPGGCIPALDDPATTDAAAGDWYPDDATVFGIVVGDDALAIPLNIAEIHEMFNLTLGDRRLGIPYCTLCGSAQAYFTDNTGAADEPVLRTSGLLSRSNKVMYDLRTQSVFDTFTGDAVSGPLQDEGITLEETTVVRSTWGEWKAEHPTTMIIAEDGGIGRSYDPDPLRGRDDDGPIFPIGDVDGELGVQEFVVGVITADGTPVAFPSDLASDTIDAGGAVEFAGVRLEASGDGLVAVDATSGEELSAHEAFWFAWSQFHPDTELWTG
ncbi:MAG: DUF3179 domain-containing (seleno)protein [Actinomycetota bacterium]